MNTNRIDFTFNYPVNSTSYWLLGFVEGDGTWVVDKKNYLLIFSIAQPSKDLKLMVARANPLDKRNDASLVAIKNYLNNLNSQFNDLVSLGTSKTLQQGGSGLRPTSMVNLTVNKTEALSQVIISLFKNMAWPILRIRSR